MWRPRRGTGRTLRYLELRATEMLDPTSIYGRPLRDLEHDELIEFLGYVYLRAAEQVSDG